VDFVSIPFALSTGYMIYILHVLHTCIISMYFNPISNLQLASSSSYGYHSQLNEDAAPDSN